MRALQSKIFTPFLRHLMPVPEHFLKFWRDNQRCGERAEYRDRHFVFYLVPQNGSIGVRLDNMPVPPASERAGDLHVFKHPRRIVCRVLRDPFRGYEPQDLLFDDRTRTDLRNIRLLYDPGVFPRRYQSLERIRQFVKCKYPFRRGIDHTFFNKLHSHHDSTKPGYPPPPKIANSKSSIVN